MKVFYIAGSILFTVLILIVGFGNIMTTCSNATFLFSSVKASSTLLVFGVAAFGIIAGMFYHALLVRIMNDANNEEYDEDDNEF